MVGSSDEGLELPGMPSRIAQSGLHSNGNLKKGPGKDSNKVQRIRFPESTGHDL